MVWLQGPCIWSILSLQPFLTSPADPSPVPGNLDSSFSPSARSCHLKAFAPAALFLLYALLASSHPSDLSSEDSYLQISHEVSPHSHPLLLPLASPWAFLMHLSCHCGSDVCLSLQPVELRVLSPGAHRSSLVTSEMLNG